MKSRIRFSLAFAIILLTTATARSQVNSHARMVRLSYVEGEVAVQRPDVQAWSAAPVNTPLSEGFRLSTADGGFAEVEFENGGTVRLGEQSLLEMTVLELDPNGAAINHLTLHQGYATFHPQRGESLQVETPYGIVSAEGGSKFRVDLDQGTARVEVFAGSIVLENDAGGLKVDQDSVLLLQPTSGEPPLVSQGITRDDWDNWVDSREAQPASQPTPDDYAGNGVENTYGWRDLLQYGTWSNVSGEGYGWSPNLTPAGWSPYSMGQWCWYPGWGYTWIAAEPWGWLPYHYGGWTFIGGRGWVWFPGQWGSWSPAQVSWYKGPGWVGWIPRHQKDDGRACAGNCGGGVMSTSAFRSGGMVGSNLMLNINPATGEKINQPSVAPTLQTKLTGQPISFRGARPNGSTIVYDPQQSTYVNSDRAASATSPRPVWPVNGNIAQPANNNGVQPVPVTGRTAETSFTNPGTSAGGSHAPVWNTPAPGSRPNYAGQPGHGYGGRAPATATGETLSRGGDSGATHGGWSPVGGNAGGGHSGGSANTGGGHGSAGGGGGHH